MSPKGQFLKDPVRVNKHKDLVDSESVKDSLMAAFNEFCWRLPSSTTPERSWATSPMREGAQEFINVFLTLADQPKSVKPTDAGILQNPDAAYIKRHGRQAS